MKREKRYVPQQEEIIPGNLKRKIRHAVTIGVLATAMFTAEGISPERDSDTETPDAQTQKQPDEFIPIHRKVTGLEKHLTQQEVQEFCANQLHVLKELIENHEYPIPEIKERYVKLLEDIRKRYQKAVSIQVTVNYNPIGKEVIAASTVTKEDGPKLGIFTPALKDIWERYSRESDDPNWKEKFENLTIVSVLHELDHLSSGYVITPTNQDTSLEGRVLREKHAWALTCQNTMEILIKNGKRLDPSHQLRYDAWIKAGRDVNSPVWEEFIRRIHRPLYDK
ncbi:MAG: hypothetical protein A2666_04260 [Parcubacteria group bacterium RIFCSPHIGHO2_01_FULL_47_10b]|nr:MAG: hypothetical protein A2666_04260 [Parcubacteria group bacterium RIFCSPHIGHO2_01_FULL_47_10b]